MTHNKSHGRHGGNRGSGESRDDNNPNRQARNRDAESQAGNRNPDRGGGQQSSHDKKAVESPFFGDDERNPGIGQSMGSFATGEDPAILTGENSMEGDVENDANAQGGIDEQERARTND